MTLILPPAVPLPAVVTVTFAPLFSAASIEALFTTALVALTVSPHTLLLLVAVLAAVLIVMLVGSISHSPARPALAASTRPSIVSVWPEVSTKPPSPALLPTRIVALPPITVRSARPIAATSPTLPSVSPPITTRPPPATPLASITAPSSTPTRVPPNTTAPPRAPAPCPETSIVPEVSTSPLVALSTTWPSCPVRLVASIRPLLFTAALRRLSIPAAVSDT